MLQRLRRSSSVIGSFENPMKPQPTVVSGDKMHGGFVTIHLARGADVKAVAKACAALPQVAARLAKSDSKDRLPLLAALMFSKATWARITGSDAMPVAMPEFKARQSAAGEFPATGGDVFLHVKADTYSLCYELVRLMVGSFPAGSVDRFEDVYGFTYRDNRDLSGFIDGTDNPKGDDKRTAAAVVTDASDAAFTGSSFCFTMKFQHNLPVLDQHPVPEQEKIVGRTKPDSVELDPLPEDSHVGRMDDAPKIVRQSMPWGTVAGPHGLFFIAYVKDLKTIDMLLDRMLGLDGKKSDRLMTFVTPQSGSYWFVPSNGQLASLAGL